jgi:peptidoglycan/LPS O-acetylase OafA/YrhL
VVALAPALTRRAVEPPADLSYGVYLYGWPVQQALHALFPALGAVALLWPSLLATLVVAMLSWFLVEKPALGLKRRLLRAS